MLSYRHAFHAGNHADVFKHSTLLAILDYLNQKDKNYYYIDTHAGAGWYVLTESYAAQNAEYENGIGKLWQRGDAPETLKRYVELIRACNPDGTLQVYPGSPMIAQRVMRPNDRLRLFELHPADYDLLCQNCAEGIGNKRIQEHKQDGFAAMKAVLPPPTRRGMVLIDPSYEVKSDYRNVVTALREGMRRFANGVYMLWYPQLCKPEVRTLATELEKLPFESWLHATLNVCKPSRDGFGMFGSSIFIGNPPWTLTENLSQILPYLAKHLAQDDGADFLLTTS